MKRILRLSTLAGAIVTAVCLASWAPVSQREANAGTFYYGGYAPGYGGYSGYGYTPYANRGYAYVAPRAYVYPSYRAYGFGNGFGTGGTYNGMNNYGYGGSGFYGQPVRPAYNPYGYGGYGPYGFRVQHDYGY